MTRTNTKLRIGGIVLSALLGLAVLAVGLSGAAAADTLAQSDESVNITVDDDAVVVDIKFNQSGNATVQTTAGEAQNLTYNNSGTVYKTVSAGATLWPSETKFVEVSSQNISSSPSGEHWETLRYPVNGNITSQAGTLESFNESEFQVSVGLTDDKNTTDGSINETSVSVDSGGLFGSSGLLQGVGQTELIGIVVVLGGLFVASREDYI